MPHLLYSARDRRGKPTQGFVDAPGAAEAHRTLQAHGLGDVVVHQVAMMPSDPALVAGRSAREQRELARVNIAAMRDGGLGSALAGTARINRWWLLTDVGIFVLGATLESPWLMVGALIAGSLPFAVCVWKYRHASRYRALLQSFAIGEWDQVRALAARLQGAPSQDVAFDLATRLAAIRARSGDLAGAAKDMEPWRARALAPGLFENRLASIHAAAGDRAGCVRLMGEARASSPNEPTCIVDHALAEARFGDAATAEALIAQVDPAMLPPYFAPFVEWVRGLVQLRGGHPAAVERLGRASTMFRDFMGEPGVLPSLACCASDYALALAAAGRNDEARREIAQVWPVLRAHADEALLRQLADQGLAPN